MREEAPRCIEARERLLHGEGAPEHLGSCPACRSFARRLALVDRTLVAAPPGAEPPEGLAARVVAAVLAEAERRQRRREAVLLGSLAVGLWLATWGAAGWVGEAATAALHLPAASWQAAVSWAAAAWAYFSGAKLDGAAVWAAVALAGAAAAGLVARALATEV